MTATFNGNNSIISASTFAPPTVCSVSLWFYATNLSGYRRLMGINNSWEIRCSDTTLLHELYQVTPPQTTVSVSTWHHTVCSYASSSSNLQLWLNGILVSTVETQTPPSFSNAALSIGNRTGASSSEGWCGMISDVRIYNLQLSQSQVETIYTTEGRDGIAEGLINRWTIDEGAPDTVIGGAGTVKDSAGSLHMGAVNSPTYAESRLGIVKRF